VRLKENIEYTLLCFFCLFQFLLVRLKEAEIQKKAADIAIFQFLLVRLKAKIIPVF